jgi:hypothetical protein
MENKLANFIFSTKLGAYLLAVYLLIYFVAVFLVGIDHAGADHLAHKRNEQLTQLSEMSFKELGKIKVEL